MAFIALAVLLLVVTCLYWFFGPADNVEETVVDQNEDEPLIIGDKFKVLNSSELIISLQLEPVITNLQGCLGFSNEVWAKDALPFINSFLEFVQRLPASESHHHAGDGGLARHTLDVAILALTASQANSWPPGAKTEDIARLTAAWRYGIMIAAMLHDIGKTMTGFQISLFNGAKDEKSFLWFPDVAGAMRETGAKYYRVNFPDKKEDYTKHTQLAWIFFQQLVPASTRTWLSKADASLMETLRDYLTAKVETDKNKAAFANIIREADKVSTARDLKHGSRQRFSSAKLKPLIEIIIDSLREMLAQKGSFLSIGHTAGGHLFRQDDLIYVTCPNVINILRQYLKDTGSQYARLLPVDNTRIFDTLLESNAIIPAPYDQHKSVWQITTRFTKNDGQTKNEPFTVLCFKIETLYPDSRNYPSQYQGELIVHQKLVKEIKEAELLSPQDTNVAENEPENTVNKQKIKQQVKDIAIPEPPKLRTEATPQIKQSTSTVELSSPDDLLNLVYQNSPATDEFFEEPQPNKSNTTDPIPKPKNSGLSLQANQEKLKALQQLQKQKDNKTEPAIMIEKIENVASSVLPQEAFEEDASETIMDFTMNEIAKMPIHSPNAVVVHNKPDNSNLKLELNKLTNPVNVDDPIKSNLFEQGNRFLHFLANGLADGSLIYNESSALIHFVPQGMLLVTPEIFAKCTGIPFDRKDKGNISVVMQRGFEYLGIHEKCQSSRKSWGKTAHWTVIRSTDDDNRRLFSAYLIADENLHRVIQPASRPSNNPLIKLLESPLDISSSHS